MTRSELLAFIRTQRHAVVASLADDGRPQAAYVGVGVTDDLELVFDTLGTTRKAGNLRRDPRVAAVLTAGPITVQIDGVADEPTGAERERLVAAYFDAFPDGKDRLAWPGLTHFRIRPTWIRASDFGGPEPRIEEIAP